MSQVVVYPRGFLGYDIGLPVRQTASNPVKNLQDSFLNSRPVNRDRTVISNTAIENLYKTLLQGAWIPNNFEFRERVLDAALGAFGTKSFLDWCKLQEESVYFTDMHKRFLNDTFGFITTGERTMQLRSWMALVDLRPAPVHSHGSEYAYRKYFKMEQAALLRRSFRIEDNLQSWLSQPGGLEDMLTSLHILFGDAQ